jgi:solute carrier family 35 protein F1/2
MIGFFGCMFTLILFPLLERDAVYELFADSTSFLPTMGVIILYAPLLSAYYIAATLFLVSSDATLLNLSLQSSNLWAILFSIAAFREVPPLLFYVAVFFVVSGVFVYELLGDGPQDRIPKSTSPPTTPEKNHASTGYLAIETASR